MHICKKVSIRKMPHTLKKITTLESLHSAQHCFLFFYNNEHWEELVKDHAKWKLTLCISACYEKVKAKLEDNKCKHKETGICNTA